MALQVGDIMQISIVGEIFDQRVLTILHYRVTTGSASGTVYGDTLSWAQYFGGLTAAGQLLTRYLACCAPEYLMTEIRAQRVAPTRNPYATDTVNSFGTSANAARFTNLAGSIAKRGAIAGRWAIGRVQMPGLPSDDIVDGEISVGQLTNYGTLALSLAQDQNNVGITQVVSPCIFNPTRTPNYTEIVAWDVQRSARTMHRRTLRLGE